MYDVSSSDGRTILFVSHNMDAISNICNRVICLSGGHIELDTDNVREGVDLYVNGGAARP